MRVTLLDKQILLEIFEEVLVNWKTAQGYVIQDTYCFDDDYDHDELEKEVQNYRNKFIEALNT